MSGEWLRVPVYYDFASSLCYVAHRVAERIAPELDDLAVELVWTPLDLARILPFRRGAPIEARGRANVGRVSAELEVPLRIPSRWLDSRFLLGTALLADDAGRGPIWRERVWSSLYAAGQTLDGRDAARKLATEVGLSPVDAALDVAIERLEALTREARRGMVLGVPTFMLGDWPFGGIQEDRVMLHVLGRFARKARAAARQLH